MEKILLAGAAGQGNPGDEALLEAFLEALPDYAPVVVSRDPEATAARYGCAAVHPRSRIRVLRELRASRGVVVAGGTILKRLHPASGRRPDALLASTLALTTAARGAGRPVALLGIGAGDLSTPRSRRLARAVADDCDLVVLRDEESAVILEGAGARTPFRVGADPAWTLLGRHLAPGERPAEEGAARLVVALSRYAAGGDGAFGAALGRALAEVAARRRGRLHIDLQPWEAGDLDLAASVRKLVPSARVVAPPSTLLEARRQLAPAWAVVGARFHALVAAAAAGTPFVAVAHEAKLAALARRFAQPAVLPHPAALDDLPDLVEAAVAGGGPARARAEEEVARAEEGFRLLRLLLSGGVDGDLSTLAGLPLVPEPRAR